MGAESSVQRDGKSQEDAPASASASAGELSAEVNALQEGSSVLDSKVSSMFLMFTSRTERDDVMHAAHL